MLYTRYVKNLIAGYLIMASGSIIAATIEVPGSAVLTLQDAVITASSGDTIEITADIDGSLAGNHDVIIDGKTLIFEGTGYTIDLYSAGRLFDIMSSSTVTIQNWTIQNGNSTNGGAIYNAATATLVMNGCTLKNNASDSWGGAIFTRGTLELTDCAFRYNEGWNSGAIYNEQGNLTLTDCLFSQNKVTVLSGGAIYNDEGSLNVANSIFNANTAASDGGAIYSNGSLTITSCTFNGNISSWFGGAIYNDENGLFNIMYSTFDANSATSDGGALDNENSVGGSHNIKCCRIIQNSASSGSAIYSAGPISAEYNWWGTNDDPSTITNLFSGPGTITSNPWITMSLSSLHALMGLPAIVTASFTKDGTCTIPDTSITFTTTDGIVTPTQTMVVDGIATATFVASNTTSIVCVQIDEQSECAYAGSLIVDLDGTYTNIQAAVNDAVAGDTIYITAGQTFTGAGNYNVDLRGLNLTFDRYGVGDNPIIDLDSQGRLFDIASTQTITMSNLIVKNGRADKGGVINANGGNLILTTCTFNNNTAFSGEGGAIYANGGSLILTTCTFNNNTVTYIEGAYGGGAIYYINGPLSITGCTFSGNSAYRWGGAIAVCGCPTFTVTTCIFSGNSAFIGEGGAIDACDCSTFTATTCIFSGNSAPQGGAISIPNSTAFSSTASISCSRFVGNSSDDGMSDAIYVFKDSDTVAAINNWWGTNTPDASSLFGGAGTVDYTPWMVASINTDPVTVAPGSTVSLLTDFTYNSSGQEITACSLPATPVGFSTTDGTITSPLENTVDGIATTTLITNYSGLSFTVSATVGPDEEMYSITREITPDPINPGISLITMINSSTASIAAPGVVVELDSTMNISYLVTNIGNVTLNIEVTDAQEYDITPSTTILGPDESITCTATWDAPDLNELHENQGKAMGTTASSEFVSAKASAYATSIPVNPYRFNFGCICTDDEDDHILIGSHNMPALEDNSLDFWTLNVITPTVSLRDKLDLGGAAIMDSATYNTDEGMNIAVLTQTQEGDTALVLVTYNETATLHSITPLSSQAFKAQWAVSSNGTPYIVTDAQDGMSLYEVDLNSYTVTLRSSVPNLGAGLPSAFLRWYPQGDNLYVIQGYGQTLIATYKVNLTTGTIETGVLTGLSGYFTAINSCATCYNYLVLGGVGIEGSGKLVKYTIHESGGYPVFSGVSRIIEGTSAVNYCERCCCGGNPILVATDYGFYSLKADDLTNEATYTDSEWINVCWCCDMIGNYCIAVSSNHETFVFRQEGDSFTPVIGL